MRLINLAISSRIVRFTLAGSINTTVNFAILNFMTYGLNQNKFVSIIISTSCAIGVSFVLNRGFVFNDRDQSIVKLRKFIIVTLIGVFITQILVFIIASSLLRGSEAGLARTVYSLVGLQLGNSVINVNISNIIASLAVMIWNYNGYKLFVFNTAVDKGEIVEELSAEAN